MCGILPTEGVLCINTFFLNLGRICDRSHQQSREERTPCASRDEASGLGVPPCALGTLALGAFGCPCEKPTAQRPPCCEEAQAGTSEQTARRGGKKPPACSISSSFPAMSVIPSLVLDMQEKPLCCAESLSCVRLSASPWTGAHQSPLPWEFSRQECWNGFAKPSSRGSSQARDRTHVSCIAGRLFTV